MGCRNTVCEETESCSVCPIDCNVCNFTEEEIISKTEFNDQPTNSLIENLLTESNFSQSEINEALEIAREVQINRSVEIEKKSTNEGWTSFETIIKLSFSNSGDNELKNVKIVEQIPKELALNSSQIIADFPFIVLKEDPIIQFEIFSIQPNSTATVSYLISKPERASDETIQLFSSPVILSLRKIELSQPIQDCILDTECNDNNTCTRDSCINNKCVFASSEDGLVCGFGKECKSGICTEVPSSVKTQQPTNDSTLIIIIIIIIVVISVYAVSKTRKK